MVKLDSVDDNGVELAAELITDGKDADKSSCGRADSVGGAVDIVRLPLVGEAGGDGFGTGTVTLGLEYVPWCPIPLRRRVAPTGG